MQVSANGVKFVKKWEGLYLYAYDDGVGVCTIGYGHTGPDVYWGQRITEEQADKWLAEDLVSHMVRPMQVITRKLTQNQYDALASFAFNLGSYVFDQNPTLLGYINTGQFEKAGDLMLKFSYGGGKFMQGLYNRRVDERKLLLTPDSTTQKPEEKPTMPTIKEDEEMLFIYEKKRKTGNATDVYLVFGDKRMHLPSQTYVKEAKDLIKRYGGSTTHQVYGNDNFGVKMIEKATTEVKL